MTLFAIWAAEKLRGQQGHAGKALVFTHTSPHRPGPQYGKNIVLLLRRPTSNTADLVAAAVRGIRQIYRPGYELINAGVMLLDLQPASRRQHGLALDDKAQDTGRLMTALDRINDRYGRGTLAMASAGTVKTQRDWGMKRERRASQYTTCWEEVPVVRA
ncbi:MAG: DUF4113 domain-containing protein [Nitrospira sp.]